MKNNLGTYYEIWHLNGQNLYDILEKIRREVLWNFEPRKAKAVINTKIVDGDFPNTSSMLYWVANEINYMFRKLDIRIRVVS